MRCVILFCWLCASLVKDCVDILLTPITSIVNLSLSEGSFPSHFKSAIISPLLKKPTIDNDNMKNYWPVSNLSFLFKFVGKVVASHLNVNTNISTNALVSGRLDYCNSLFCGIADTDLTRVQHVRNRLARIWTESPPFTHSVPLLHSLHWLLLNLE